MWSTGNRGNNGFSLIEMAVVLLVVALFAGSIFVGADLLRSSKIRATAKQLEMFDTAYASFRLKYNCLPGDCMNASDFGFTGNFKVKLTQAQEPVYPHLPRLNPISSAYAGDITCPSGEAGCGGSGPPPLPFPLGEQAVVSYIDGNGNWVIDNASNFESAIFWSLLAQANMLKNYNASTGRVDTEVPAILALGGYSKSYQQQAFWWPADLSIDDASTSLIKKDGLYYLAIAALNPSVPGAGAVVKAQDAYQLDSKMDDAMPLSGKVLATGDPYLNLVNGPTFEPGIWSGPAGSNSNACVADGADGASYAYNAQSNKAPCALLVAAAI